MREERRIFGRHHLPSSFALVLCLKRRCLAPKYSPWLSFPTRGMTIPIHPHLMAFRLVIIGLISFLRFCKCDDSISQKCTDSQCGLVPIKYPFGISNQGCGHPLFQIECLHGRAVLAINKQRFTVLRITYSKLDFPPGPKIRLIAESVSPKSCGLPNTTVDLNDSPFRRVSPLLNLMLFSGCHGQRAQNNLQPIACNASCYLSFGDPEWNTNVPRHCASAVQIPISPFRLTYNGLFDLLQQGFQLEWKLPEDEYQRYCRDCKSAKGICGYNASDAKAPFLCYRPGGRVCSYGGKGYAWVTAVSCVGGTLLVVAAAALFAALRLKRRNPYSSNENRGSDRSSREDIVDIVDDASSNMQMASSDFPIMFSYKELQEATNFFDIKRELGDGGFGCVYLGTLCDGRTVAVKRLHDYNSRRVEQFVNEVNILSSVCHPNLVRLFGCCQDHQNLLLVFEYIPNGTLADHLHGEKKGKGLLWETRLNIAIETAQALAFLHFCVEPPIIHRDVKSSNILLNENLRVRVADFGLSRLLPLKATHVSTIPQGTPGYLDPDYHRCYQLTDKSDVYSFGVVLMEIISAKEAVDITRDREEINLASLAISKIQSGALNELVDPQLGFEYNPLVKSMVTGVAELAFRCLASGKDDRPSMIEVVSHLQQINQMGFGFVENVESRQNSSKKTKKNAKGWGDRTVVRILSRQNGRSSPLLQKLADKCTANNV